nr:immunoglobulin light chain junction region [Macaca mulatta]MOW42222.1 immunoglobulin light chain junction region [Macaca mulatta]
CQQNSDWPRTF